MPVSPASTRLLLRVTTWTALAVSVTLGGIIFALPNPPLSLHEIAGGVLLILILGGIWAAARLSLNRSFRLLLGALVTLFVMGTLGAVLSIDALPGAFSSLPLAPLAILVVLLLVTAASAGDRAYSPPVDLPA